jgi:TRAP-type C4-dicarboxylate transport system substrate-binding protein
MQYFIERRRIMKKLLIVSLAMLFSSLLAFAPPSFGGPLPEVKWKIAEPCFGKDSDRFGSMERIVKAVSERTDGKFKLALFGPEIGDWVEVAEMVTRGTMHMTLNSMPTTFDPRWNIVYCPYVVSTYKEAQKAYGPGGFMDKMYSRWAKDSNWFWLGTWIQGFSGVSLSTRPASTPKEATGLKIRVPPVAAFDCYFKALGFTPILIPYSEVPTAIATGLVNGQAGGGPFQTWSCCRDLNKYFVWYRDYLETEGYYVNMDSWNSLPKEYQKILQEEVSKEVLMRVVEAEKWDRHYLETLKVKHGFGIVDLAEEPEKLAAATEASRKCWSIMDNIIGKIWMDEIRKNVGMPIK